MAMKLKVFQKGFNYSQDGPGNRLVLHLQGCNMRCPWCSNPEGLEINGTLMTDKEWLYEGSCRKGAVKNGQLDRSICCECNDKECVTGTRQKGIRLSCREYETDDIVLECERSKSLFFDNGGVTLTGGEISVQADAVLELLKRLKQLSVNCAVETNGSSMKLVKLIPFVDEWIIDVKHYNSEVHKKWVGTSNDVTGKIVEAVTGECKDVLIRVPLIPGFNDSTEDAAGFVVYFKEHIRNGNARIEFLRYHEFGKAKWEQCGLEYKMPSVKISDKTLVFFERTMKENGFVCIHT